MTGTIVDVPGITVGHAEDETGRTGCTAVLAVEGAVGGVDVRGSAPGTRETDLLAPTALVERIHAVVLCGGSAFGLDAAGGVMAWLRERGIGYEAAGYRVPIVCAAVLFDLQVSEGRAPDREMGYRAAAAANAGAVVEGNAGAGAGATVGKVRGMAHAMKGGLGSASIALAGGAIVGAIVAVNALGSVIDPESGSVVAGVRDDAGRPQNAARALLAGALDDAEGASNTTLAVVATNAALTKAQATKVAAWSQDALARTIVPAHTTRDGDTVFAMSTGEVAAGLDLVGVAAVEVLSRAIVRAVKAARSLGGIVAAGDLSA